MTTEIVSYQESTGLPALSAEQVRARVNLIQQVMQGVMKNGTHYGTIPGAGDKPALLKPGAETLAVTFRIAVDPVVMDLSTSDEVHYRVECRGLSQVDGSYLGSGIGEASSSEEKYRWRKAVNDAEFDETAEDRRRLKWARGKGGTTYQIKQVRTHPADVANTILKMAKKRAQVDMTLSVTGASDIFAQDIEDLPEELRSVVGGEEGAQPAQASTIGAACLAMLHAEMGRVDLSAEQVKKNLAAKAKYRGQLEDMPHPVWEALMAGLATMKTKTPPAPDADAPAPATETAISGAPGENATTEASEPESPVSEESAEGTIPGLDADEFRARNASHVERER